MDAIRYLWHMRRWAWMDQSFSEHRYIMDRGHFKHGNDMHVLVASWPIALHQMNTAEQVTRLEAEVARLRESLRKAVRGTELERTEAECDLLLIELEQPRRDVQEMRAAKASFFDVARDMCAEPFRKPHFPA